MGALAVGGFEALGGFLAPAAEAAAPALGEGALAATSEGLPFIEAGAAGAEGLAAPTAALSVGGTAAAEAPAAAGATSGLFDVAGAGGLAGGTTAVGFLGPEISAGGAGAAGTAAGAEAALATGLPGATAAGGAPPSLASAVAPGQPGGGIPGGPGGSQVSGFGMGGAGDPTSERILSFAGDPGPSSAASSSGVQAIDTAAPQSLDQLATNQAVGATPKTVAPTTLQAPAAAGGAAASTPSTLDSLLKYAPLAGAGIGAAGLGYALYNQSQNKVPSVSSSAQGQQQLIQGPALAEGAKLTATGTPLTQYVGTDTLPGPEQAALDNATNAAKQRAIANAASSGQPTDPSKNSVLAQTLSQIDQQALVTKQKLQTDLATTGTSLINAGLSQTQLANNIFNSLIAVDQTQTQQVGQAIASMAAALSGKTTIQIGGTSKAA